MNVLNTFSNIRCIRFYKKKVILEWNLWWGAAHSDSDMMRSDIHTNSTKTAHQLVLFSFQFISVFLSSCYFFRLFFLVLFVVHQRCFCVRKWVFIWTREYTKCLFCLLYLYVFIIYIVQIFFFFFGCCYYNLFCVVCLFNGEKICFLFYISHRIYKLKKAFSIAVIWLGLVHLDTGG